MSWNYILVIWCYPCERWQHASPELFLPSVWSDPTVHWFNTNNPELKVSTRMKWFLGYSAVLLFLAEKKSSCNERMVVRLALTREGYMQGIWEEGSQFSITGWEHYPTAVWKMLSCLITATLQGAEQNIQKSLCKSKQLALHSEIHVQSFKQEQIVAENYLTQISSLPFSRNNSSWSCVLVKR